MRYYGKYCDCRAYFFWTPELYGWFPFHWGICPHPANLCAFTYCYEFIWVYFDIFWVDMIFSLNLIKHFLKQKWRFSASQNRSRSIAMLPRTIGLQKQIWSWVCLSFRCEHSGMAVLIPPCWRGCRRGVWFPGHDVVAFAGPDQSRFRSFVSGFYFLTFSSNKQPFNAFHAPFNVRDTLDFGPHFHRFSKQFADFSLVNLVHIFCLMELSISTWHLFYLLLQFDNFFTIWIYETVPRNNRHLFEVPSFLSIQRASQRLLCYYLWARASRF